MFKSYDQVPASYKRMVVVAEEQGLDAFTGEMREIMENVMVLKDGKVVEPKKTVVERVTSVFKKETPIIEPEDEEDKYEGEDEDEI